MPGAAILSHYFIRASRHPGIIDYYNSKLTAERTDVAGTYCFLTVPHALAETQVPGGMPSRNQYFTKGCTTRVQPHHPLGPPLLHLSGEEGEEKGVSGDTPMPRLVLAPLNPGRPGTVHDRIFKVIAMAITNGSGGIGGVFAPSLFTGGLTGFIFATSATDAGDSTGNLNCASAIS